MHWVLCLHFQVQYTFGPLYSFLVRSPFDRDNIHTRLFSKFILFNWRMRSLIASSPATCLTLFHLSSLGKQCSMAWERNAKRSGKVVPCTRHEGRGTVLLIRTWTSCTREKSLAPDRIRTPDRPVVEYVTATPWEVTNRSKRQKRGKVWEICCVSHNLCDYWSQFAQKKCAHCRQTWISQQGNLPFRVQALSQGRMKPARWVAVVTTFSTAACSRCGSSRLNLLHATLLAPRILRQVLHGLGPEVVKALRY